MTIDNDDGATRRQMLTAAGAVSLAAIVPENALAATAPKAGSSGNMIADGYHIGPTILEYLSGLEGAVNQLANTWHPDDPRYRAGVYQQIMMNLAFSYFAYFAADAEHPDWSPLYNPVFADQPNPDDIYLFSPIRDDLSYRVSGNRGTVKKFIFVTQKGIPGTLDNASEYGSVNSLDEQDFNVEPHGEFEIIFSAKRPEGFEGNWSELKPGANVIFSRYRMIDWTTEHDPQMSIECLDRVPLKPRLTPEQIIEKIKLMTQVPGNQNKVFFKMQNDVKTDVGFNVFNPVHIPGLTKQVYWPAAFQLDDGEALIIETEMPEVRPYWNIQLNDPLFNAVEYVYRISSLNASTAKISSDGKLRAVVALEDPGVPNWLDPAGFKEGTIYGRWYECSTTPTPIIKRVPLAKLRDYLPSETPTVAPQERARQLRERVLAAQRRRRW